MNQQYKAGFGCASLSGLNDRSKALELLAHAYDEGITHFDVARLYGMGHTEGIVGEFAKDKRDKITITSKFGLNPPAFVAANKKAVSIIKSIVKKIPGLKKAVTRKMNSAILTDFSLKNAEESLEKSLRALHTDHIDHYLLHEAAAADANNEALIFFLEQKVREGKILDYGIGSGYEKIKDDCNSFNDAYHVFQFDSNVFNENIVQFGNRENKLVITHSTFYDAKILERNLARSGARFIKSHSEALGIDLNDNSMFTGMLLFHAALLNPGGVTLFSSTRKEHISNNLNCLERFSKIEFNRDAFAILMSALKNGAGE